MRRAIIVMVLLLAFFQIESTTQHVKLVKADPVSSSEEYPTPSVPQFSLKYSDNSYYINGNYIQNKSVQVVIKNQPANNVLCYNVNSKNPSSENWTLYDYYNNSTYPNPQFLLPNRLLAWNSNVTILVFGFEGNNGSTTYNLILGKANDGDQIDFQVQAYIGNWFSITVVNATTSIDYNLLNIDAIGDWSPTQTIIPASSISPTITPAVPEIPQIVNLPLLLSMFSVAVIVRRRNRSRNFDSA